MRSIVRAELTYENVFRTELRQVGDREDLFHWVFVQGDVPFYSCGICHLVPCIQQSIGLDFIWWGSLFSVLWIIGGV